MGGGLFLAAAPVLLVICSGMIHAVWNLFAKRSRNKIVFLWLLQCVAVVAYLPLVGRELTGITIAFAGYKWLLASMIVHGAYTYLLAKAYTVGDLSQAYPLMRGTAPLLVPMIGVLLLGERLTLLGWAGVAQIVAGIVLLSLARTPLPDKGTSGNWQAMLLAMAVGVSIAAYTIFDKLALQYISPLTLNWAGNLGNLIALLWPVLRTGEIRQEWASNWRTVLLGGVLAPGGYLLFLYAVRMAAVSQLAPMREIGTVFGTVLGIVILRESHGIRRFASSVLITTGVIMLGIWGK